ncbi:hypothetical protein HOLleu_42811 [Holothuria leucospilota]|uniref:Uncharacterized protein n=1 Tax=Holothuria leucospilota TaxID=206669 RepID=A0A9Q1B9Z0_HOLLE|nr:hypothetical protein HOLleu_42811 [Holothuria leucospilota]
MSSPVVTNTPIEETNAMRSELKRLRRQNAVLLDLGVAEKLKYDNVKEVPPTPSDEDTQLLWPSPVNSPPTPPPTVLPLQKG